MSPRRTGHPVATIGPIVLATLSVVGIASWSISGVVPGLAAVVHALHSPAVQEYGTWLALVGLLAAGLLVLRRDDEGDEGDEGDETDRAGHRDLSGSRRG